MKPEDSKARQTPFESFVQRIAAVPKETVEQLEAERPKRVKPKRRLKVKTKAKS